MTFTVEPVKLLPTFLAEFRSLGGKVVSNVKISDLTQLGADYDLVINCTGVWSKYLANDDKVNALRGQVMRVKAPWLKKVLLDDADDGNYIIPK